jgi:hypothetical protein
MAAELMKVLTFVEVILLSALTVLFGTHSAPGL